MGRGTSRAANRRGLRTADGMILVAAVALGFALSGTLAERTRGVVAWSRFHSEIDFIRKMTAHRPFSAWNLAHSLSGFGTSLSMYFSPFLAAVGAALIPIRLLPPRPRPRRLAIQPGTSAAIAAMVAVVCLGGFLAAAKLTSSKDATYAAGDLALLVLWLPIFVGFSIASAWSALAAVGLWRPEPCWIDRLGRAVGLTWIVAGVVNAACYLVFGLDVSVGAVFIRYST